MVITSQLHVGEDVVSGESGVDGDVGAATARCMIGVEVVLCSSVLLTVVRANVLLACTEEVVAEIIFSVLEVFSCVLDDAVSSR